MAEKPLKTWKLAKIRPLYFISFKSCQSKCGLILAIFQVLTNFFMTLNFLNFTDFQKVRQLSFTNKFGNFLCFSSNIHIKLWFKTIFLPAPPTFRKKKFCQKEPSSSLFSDPWPPEYIKAENSMVLGENSFLIRFGMVWFGMVMVCYSSWSFLGHA